MAVRYTNNRQLLYFNDFTNTIGTGWRNTSGAFPGNFSVSAGRLIRPTGTVNELLIRDVKQTAGIIGVTIVLSSGGTPTASQIVWNADGSDNNVFMARITSGKQLQVYNIRTDGNLQVINDSFAGWAEGDALDVAYNGRSARIYRNGVAFTGTLDMGIEPFGTWAGVRCNTNAAHVWDDLAIYSNNLAVASISEWNGSQKQPLILKGEWNGTAIRPIRLKSLD